MLIREMNTCMNAYANKEFRAELKKGHLPIVWLCILSDLSLMLLIYHIVKKLIRLERLFSTLILSDIPV